MLSEREQQILVLVAQGLSNKQIALQLDISDNTVKVHLRNIFSKINVASRTEATLYAIRQGLLDVALPPRDPLPIRSVIPRWWWVGLGGVVGIVVAMMLLWQPVAEIPTQAATLTRWRQLPAVPDPAAGMQFARYDGALVAVGAQQWWRLADADATWHDAGQLPCVRARGRIWADGAGVWLVGCGAGDEVWRWDGVQWGALAALPSTVQPLAVVRVEGVLWVCTATDIWHLTGAQWQRVSTAPHPMSRVHAALVDGAVYVFGDATQVWRVDAPHYTWRPAPALPFRGDTVAVSSVLGSVLLADVATATLWVYAPSSGVVSGQMVPPTVQLTTQAVQWQNYVVFPNHDGSALPAYQAVFQTFVPVVPDP